MSEQIPSAEVPQPPQQSFGTAPPPQESFGSAPSGQQTFGSAPPAEPPPGAPAAADGPPAAPVEAAPPKKKGIGVVGGVVIIVLLLAGVGVFLFLQRDKATNANVGDCLAGTTAAELDANKLSVVDCGGSDAGFKVVQRVEDKLFGEADAACTDASTQFVFWSGNDGEKGTVLCLTAVTK